MDTYNDTDNLWVEETWLDAEKGYIIGESGIYETFTDSRSELYRSSQEEYGRCTGKVYIDKDDGPRVAIGWVFLQRKEYDDSPDTYLRETWVTVHKAPPTVTRSYSYDEVPVCGVKR